MRKNLNCAECGQIVRAPWWRRALYRAEVVSYFISAGARVWANDPSFSVRCSACGHRTTFTYGKD